MLVFLVLSIIFFAISILSLISIIIFLILRRYKICGFLMHASIVVTLLSIMIMSWDIILMNKGFNVDFNVAPKFNYDWIVFASVIYLFIFILVHYILSRKRIFQEKNPWIRILGYVLPAALTAFYSLASIIFWFNVNYFYYLQMISSINM